jgi:hypothetical protein
MDDSLRTDAEETYADRIGDHTSSQNPVCRAWFCFSADVAEKFETYPARTIETFTRAVFDAEGLDPAVVDRRLYAQVRKVVATAFKGTAQNGI